MRRLVQRQNSINGVWRVGVNLRQKIPRLLGLGADKAKPRFFTGHALRFSFRMPFFNFRHKVAKTAFSRRCRQLVVVNPPFRACSVLIQTAQRVLFFNRAFGLRHLHARQGVLLLRALDSHSTPVLF